MTPDERTMYRREVGLAIMEIQTRQIIAGHEPADVGPETVAALLSLATHIADVDLRISKSEFKAVCAKAFAEPWQ